MFTIKSLANAWDKFFFEERPTEGLALFRVVWMSMIFVYFLMDLVNIQDFYGPHALISIETIKSEFPMFHANLFQLFNPSYSFTYTLMFVYGVSLIFSILGLFTRQSLFVVLICMTSIHQRNIWILSSSETLMRLILIYLVCSSCGHSLSIDSILGRIYPQFQRKKEWAVWSWRLIQIQISVVYVWTVWHKVKGDAWLDGSAVYHATRLENMANFTIPYLMDSILFLKLMTWGTLIIELALGTLIWFKEYRTPVLISGLLFHLGIEYIMCIPFFEINMMILLMNFITPEEGRQFALRNINALSNSLSKSTLGIGIKEKLASIMRGQHETAN